MNAINFDRLVDECVAIERTRAPTGVDLDVEHGFIGKPFVRALLERTLPDARQRAMTEA